MEYYKFILITDKIDILADETFFDLAEKFYEAGCKDSTLCVNEGVLSLDFYRKAESYNQALESATKDVESVEGIKVIHSQLCMDAADTFIPLSEAREKRNYDKFDTPVGERKYKTI